MTDLSHLNALATEHYFEADPQRKAALRQQLWEGAHELLKHLNLECSVMDREDMIQELTLRLVRNTEEQPDTPTEGMTDCKPEKPGGTKRVEKPGWIDSYNPSKDKGAGFVGYIASNAKLAVRNLYRDHRDGGFSRRTLEAKNQVLRLAHTEGMSLRAAKAKVVVDMGFGMDLLASLDAALQSSDAATSLETPVGPAGETWKRLEDLLAAELVDPAVLIDRTKIQVNLDTIPPRYSKILQGIMDGRDPYTEIDFGGVCSLSEKAVLIDTAFKLLRARISHRKATSRLRKPTPSLGRTGDAK